VEVHRFNEASLRHRLHCVTFQGNMSALLCDVACRKYTVNEAKVKSTVQLLKKKAAPALKRSRPHK